jgi:hypothetical protein
MSIEVKVYLTPEQNDDNLCFHAVVNKKDDYDVLVDLNKAYESLMVDALNGSLEVEYFEQDDYNRHTFNINEDTYESSINQFVAFLNEFYGLTAIANDRYLYTHFGVRLVGTGFRGSQENPMLEHSQFNARNSIHSIKTQLFTPVNNRDYIKDDIYIMQSHGSLRLTLEATKKYEEPIAFINSIYEDIENETIDPFRFENIDERYRYQTIIKNLNDLNTQKRLQALYVIIDNQEYQITKRDYLKSQAKNIYHEEIELIGIFEGYKQRSKSFELYVEGKGKYSCHLQELSNTDNEQFIVIYNKLRVLNSFTSTRIRVVGQRVKPKTINVVDIEVL